MMHEMKKKAAAEALKELIHQMMGLEGKKHEASEGLGKEITEESGDGGGTVVDKMASQGMPTDGASGGDDSDMEEEKKNFMSFKKKPMLEKSVTVVMAGPKSKKKMKGM